MTFLEINLQMKRRTHEDSSYKPLATTRKMLLGNSEPYQKQNRHVNRGVSENTPPTVGPRSDETLYTLVTRAIPNGLFFSGTDCPKIARLPQSMPAPPAPAIARPMIRTVELGAAAHVTEPTSTRTQRAQSEIRCQAYKLQDIRTDQESYHVRYAIIEERIHASPRRLAGHLGEQVGAAVPAYVFEAVELTGDFWNRGCWLRKMLAGFRRRDGGTHI